MYRIYILLSLCLVSCSEYKSHAPTNPHMDPADLADHFESVKLIDEAEAKSDTINY